ncbi:hypothetical protein BDP27DRAFT_1418421 [Rhodocollybia butyracea]|uniref:Uncharacterized protein n=1 Tax=Rhodocollybia butyracea TaxID=206335 RepID=A0A9P5UAI7_9AGAR|nr:hypothetical protein BDP27DRAFT_1418421 [Rhodocollybia butyracea]
MDWDTPISVSIVLTAPLSLNYTHLEGPALSLFLLHIWEKNGPSNRAQNLHDILAFNESEFTKVGRNNTQDSSASLSVPSNPKKRSPSNTQSTSFSKYQQVAVTEEACSV